jgi:hypothetical protein
MNFVSTINTIAHHQYKSITEHAASKLYQLTYLCAIPANAVSTSTNTLTPGFLNVVLWWPELLTFSRVEAGMAFSLNVCDAREQSEGEGVRGNFRDRPDSKVAWARCAIGASHTAVPFRG